MSDLVGNPEDRFSRVAARMKDKNYDYFSPKKKRAKSYFA